MSQERLNPEGAGRKTPLLYPADIPGSPDRVTLTVMSWQLLRQGTLVMLEFREHPGRGLWVGGHGPTAADELRYLGEQVGTDPAAWAFGRVTLERVLRRNPRPPFDVVAKYVVAPSEDGRRANKLPAMGAVIVAEAGEDHPEDAATGQTSARRPAHRKLRRRDRA